MREIVTFSLPIVALPRPALVPNGHGGIRYQNSAEYKHYKATIRAACVEALTPEFVPFDGPAEIRMVIEVTPRSQAERARAEFWKVSKPDHDNYQKGIQDALTGLVFTDDCTVVGAHAAKVMSEENRVTVQVNAYGIDEQTREFVLAEYGPR